MYIRIYIYTYCMCCQQYPFKQVLNVHIVQVCAASMRSTGTDVQVQ
jgi:hypothetical protein